MVMDLCKSFAFILLAHSYAFARKFCFISVKLELNYGNTSNYVSISLEIKLLYTIQVNIYGLH